MNESTKKISIETIPKEKKAGPNRLGLILGVFFIVLCGVLEERSPMPCSRRTEWSACLEAPWRAFCYWCSRRNSVSSG